MKLIYDLVGSERIKIDPSQLHTSEILSTYNVGMVESRFKALDIPFMLPYYKASPECQNIQLLNLHDDAVINKINSKYFERNPIELMSL